MLEAIREGVMILRMSNGRRRDARWLKTIVVVIQDWLVAWLTVDYAGAGAEERLAIRNDTWLVFGLPTTTHTHGGDQKGAGGCVQLDSWQYCTVVKFL